MRRTEAHLTDEDAQRLLAGALPREWILRKQERDYGVDYLVEVSEGGTASGRQFAVQLKGTARGSIREGLVRCVLSRAHVEYYVDRLRLPVFLVVADVSRSKCYWLSLQQHVLTTLNSSSWRHQRSLTLRIPVAHDLSDHAAFCAAVNEAEQFAVGLRPGSAEASLKAERLRLESLDPRFTVLASATEQGLHFRLSPKEALDFKLKVSGNRIALEPKVRDFVDRGLQVTFEADEWALEGLPVLQTHMGKPILLQFQRKHSSHLKVIRPCDQKSCSIFGRLIGGRQELRFEALVGDVLRVEFTVSPETLRTRMLIGTSVALASWTSCPLLNLPSFDSLYEVCSLFAQDEKMQGELWIDGNLCGSGSIAPGTTSPLARVYPLLQIIDNARSVARILGVNPQLPDLLTAEMQADVDFLWTVLRGQYQAEHDECFQCVVNTTVEGFKRMREYVPISEYSYKVAPEDFTPRFLGERVVGRKFEWQMTEMKPLLSQSEVEALLQMPDDSSVAVPLAAPSGAKIRLAVLQ